MKQIKFILTAIVAASIGWSQTGHAYGFVGKCDCTDKGTVCTVTQKLCALQSLAAANPTVVESVQVGAPLFNCPDGDGSFGITAQNGLCGELDNSTNGVFVSGKLEQNAGAWTLNPAITEPDFISQGSGQVVFLPALGSDVAYATALKAVNDAISAMNALVPTDPAMVKTIPKSVVGPGYYNITTWTDAAPSSVACGQFAIAQKNSSPKTFAMGAKVDGMIAQLETFFPPAPATTFTIDDSTYACKVTITNYVEQLVADPLIADLKTLGVKIVTKAPLSQCAKQLEADPAFMKATDKALFMVLKMKADIQSDAFLQKVDLCGVGDCAGLLDNGGFKPANGYIQFVIAQKSDAKTALADKYDSYVCDLEVLNDNQIDVYRLDGTVPTPVVAAKPKKSSPITGLDYKSTIFDTSKPLAFMPLPVSEVCGVTTFPIGKQEQVMIVQGSDVTILLDPRTQQAIACKDNNPKDKCDDNFEQVFMPMSVNADGSTHLMLMPSDGYGVSIAVDPSPVFQKAMKDLGKPLLKLMGLEAKDVKDTCDDLLKDAKTALGKTAYSLSSTDEVKYKDAAGKDATMTVKTLSYGIWGNRGVVVSRNVNLVPLLGSDGKQLIDQTTKLPATTDGGGQAVGVQVVTVGDTSDTSKIDFKALPDDVIKGNYQGADAAITLADDTHAELALAMQVDPKAAKKVIDFYSCTIPFSDKAITCEKKIVGTDSNSADVLKAMATAKLKQQAHADVKGDTFGGLIGDVMNSDPKSDPNVFLHMVMHGFDGIDNKPMGLAVGPDGSHFYRIGSDGKVALDDKEVLPGSNKGCYVADLDSYGGKDLICFVENVLYFVPKLNLPPYIDTIALNPASGKGQLNPSVRTQEDEDLSYKWSIYEMKDGVLVNHDDLLDNAATSSPGLNMAVGDASTSAPAKAIHLASGELPDVNISAAITKSLSTGKSVGAKDAPSLPSSGYFAVVTVKDSGGMSDTAVVPISAAGALNDTFLGQDMFAMEGCTLVRSENHSLPAALLALLLMPFAILIPVRVAVRIRRK